MNYAKTQPELVILAVNTFVKVWRAAIPRGRSWLTRNRQDTADHNPLIRALAIRTMSCLRAEKILDYLGDPLSRCLRDENPYVRKTAALCVAKVYELKPELCLDYGFVEVLRDLVGDGNPMVVANAVTALSDIHEATESAKASGSTTPDGDAPPSTPSATLFIIDNATLSKLLVALNECSEWGRISILNALSRYKAADEKESEHICERVMPQFQHANGAVVLGAVKVSGQCELAATLAHCVVRQVIMIHMRQVQRQDLITQLIKKMTPPLGESNGLPIGTSL